MEGLTIILYCVLLSFTLIFMFISRHGRKKLGAKDKKKLPPGPPALLFIAKFFALAPSLFQTGPILREFHARHGPILYIWLMRPFVFVADRRLAHSILVESGGNYDDRPPPTEMLRLFFPHSISISPYGAYWRLVRRNLSSRALHPSRVRLFAPARQHALNAIVGSLRGDRDRDRGVVTAVRPFLRRYLFELLVCMCLGVRLDPEALQELQEMLRQVFIATTAIPVFDFFPALTKRLLLRKRWARLLALRDRRDQVLLRLIRSRGRGRGGGAEEDQVPGGYCYADSLLELRVAEEGGRPLTDAEMINLCSEFMIGAMDTSASLIEWIMAELVNHPDVQAKVYAEVVRGKPAAELSEGDLRGMPYLKALVLEGLRLHPGAHLIIPHGVRSDGEVGGYMVPKGTELNFLVSDLGLDETVWPEAREFRPERFLEEDDDGYDITGSRDIKMAPFGAGRRMCPGYTLAMLHAGCFVGTLVRKFQWLPPAQAQQGGEAIIVDMTEDLASVIRMKHPLRARIIPRTT